MKLFIAVVFFCLGEECVFWKSHTNFYTQEECAKEIVTAVDTLEKQGVESMGTCLVVNLNQHI